MLHVLERQNDGNVRKVPAAELHAFFLQPQQKANLQAMMVEDVQAKLNLTKEMEKQYLEKVPPGLSSYMWYQAQKDNPDADNLLPVPVVGFEEMYSLLKKEDALATLSKDVCQQIGADVKRLEKKVEENKQMAMSYQDKLDRLMLRQLHVSLNFLALLPHSIHIIFRFKGSILSLIDWFDPKRLRFLDNFHSFFLASVIF